MLEKFFLQALASIVVQVGLGHIPQRDELMSGSDYGYTSIGRCLGLRCLSQLRVTDREGQ
jgi:hypothetical protein